MMARMVGAPLKKLSLETKLGDGSRPRKKMPSA